MTLTIAELADSYTYSVKMALTFIIAGFQSTLCLLNCGFEPKALVDDGDVIGGGFGDHAEGDRQLSLFDTLVEVLAEVNGAHSSDDVQLVDSLLDEFIENRLDFDFRAVEAKEVASGMVNGAHSLNV